MSTILHEKKLGSYATLRLVEHSLRDGLYAIEGLPLGKTCGYTIELTTLHGELSTDPRWSLRRTLTDYVTLFDSITDAESFGLRTMALMLGIDDQYH